jgi:hypothetical protein
MQGYNLNEEGIWDGALPAGDPASGLQWQPPFTGWINADRNFTTACVKGTVTTAAGTCKGGRVKATGPVGTASFDSSGSDGAFCVTGAQGAASQVTVGVSTTTVTMPATPGDCANPASCLDVGPLVASAAEDCAETEPPPPPPTCPGGCPVGATCLNGECVTPISCAGRCCPGQNDACMLPGASCFCDDYCITAGDCCPDFVASCQ